MLAAAAAIAVSPPGAGEARSASATVRATASVRILSGVSIRWGSTSSELPKLRLSHIRGVSGPPQPIRLVEFE